MIAVRDRPHPHRFAGRLPDRRAARVPQGRRDPRVHRRRADRRDHQHGLQRHDARPSRSSAPSRARSSWRSSSAPSPRPAPAAPTTSCRATGSATRASAWAATPRVSRRRSPARRRRRRRASSYRFPQDEENLARWRVWWKHANLEQFFSFGVIAALSIIVFSLVAYSTVYGNPDLPEESGFDFISLEAERARRAGRRLVRHAVPADRHRQPVRRRARHRRLRLAPRRRRGSGRLHGRQRALDREPHLLHLSCGRWSCSARRSCWPASTSRSCW